MVNARRFPAPWSSGWRQSAFVADGIAAAGNAADRRDASGAHSFQASAKRNASISPLSTAQFLGFWIAVDLANLRSTRGL
jgi:hypothetical protein